MKLTENLTDVIDRGIRLHAWTPEELSACDAMLQKVDLPRRWASALRMYRAHLISVVWPTLNNEEIVALNALSPISAALMPIYRSIWMPGDTALFCNLSQQEVECLDAVPEKGMNKKQFPSRYSEYRKKHPGVVTELSKPLSRFFWSRVSEIGVAKAQTEVRLTRVAIALELYRMEHGQYPESLEVLEASFPDGTPVDLITLRPFRYRRNEDGSFSLWSVGWNETDENGERDPYSRDKGDWAWGQ